MAGAGSWISAAPSVLACLMRSVKVSSIVSPGAQLQAARSTVGSSASCARLTASPPTDAPLTSTCAPSQPFI